MKKFIKIMILLLIVQGFSSIKVEASTNVERISGKDRIITSVEVSKKAYPEGTNIDTVVLSGFDGQVDSLSGTILSYKKNAPMLITRKEEVSPIVLKYIKDQGVENIYLLGGEGVISANVEKKLKDLGYKTIRKSGKGREDTAVRIAAETNGEKIEKVFLAIGYGQYADALAIGPISAKEDTPILLTKKNQIPESTKKALKDFETKVVTIIGGTGAIGKEVENELKSMGISYSRVSGKNRMDTSIEIAKKYIQNPNKLIIASGYDYADAVIGGYYGAKENAPVLLTEKKSMDNKTLEYISERKVPTYILGGAGVISDNVFKQVNVALKDPIKLQNFYVSGMKIAGKMATIHAETLNEEDLLYRFYYKDISTKKWIMLQDYKKENYASWTPKEKGVYEYWVDIKYADSPNEKDFSKEKTVNIGLSIPVFYNVTEYKDTLDQALDKQVGRGTVYGNGKATKNQIKEYFDPNNFLQFDPKDNNKSQIEGIVTTNDLNIRKGPGTEYSIVGKAKSDDLLKISSESNGWCEIEFKGGTGYVSESYVNKRTRLISVKVNSKDGLNVRKEPNASSAKLATAPNGNVYVVLDETNGWYKINVGNNSNKKIGWISGSYADYVKDVPKDMYQFMILSGQPIATANQINNELKGKGILEGKGAQFINASKNLNINELYLLAHAIHETGNGKSPLATGIKVTELSVKVPHPDPEKAEKGETITVMEPLPEKDQRVVYNMYGIGATNANPEKFGSERAYKEGWFTPEIAIEDGARWISENYINSPKYHQDTLYKMRYNSAGPVWHQYATDVAWAYKQIKIIDKTMKFYNSLDGTSLRFDIPYYK